MRKRDRERMLGEIDQLFEFGLNQYLSNLYADGRSIPGALVNEMADRLAALIREHAPHIKADVLGRPETEQMLIQWDRLRQGKD